METRLTLKQMILNKIDDSPRGYAEELAQVSGSYSSGSNLKKVLKDEKKEFDNFNGLLKIVNYIFGEDEQKLLEEYSKTLDPCNKSARIMLEYLCNNRLLNCLSQLIEKMSECNNKESREWAKVYNIQLNWQLNYHTLDVNEYLDSIREFKTSNEEIKIYLKMLRCYGFYLKQNHNMAFEISQELLSVLPEVKEEFLRSIYEIKINEILSYIHLRVRNNPLEARELAYKIISTNIGLTHKAYAHYTVGCTYLFQSYDEAKLNFNKSIEIYRQINRENVAINVEEISELLDIVWDKEVFDIYHNKFYKMYWLLKNGKDSNVELNENDMESPFYYFIKGVKENNTDFIMLSMIHFLKQGDSFFANLPKIELLKRNQSQLVIEGLINLHSI